MSSPSHRLRRVVFVRPCPKPAGSDEECFRVSITIVVLMIKFILCILSLVTVDVQTLKQRLEHALIR